MIFLVSLVLAALFIWGCARPLKKHPAPFYAAAVVIALVVIGCTWGRVSFPAWFQNWVWPLVSRGAFATALFAAVMWTGALPNGSKAIRFLMPVRGELSILACILTLGHNLAYGQTYFRLLFTQPGRLPANQRAAAVCSLVLILIMLPLFITSFQTVRKKMNPRGWKRLQRLAYGFYALLYVHIMLLSVPYALAGRGGYALNVLVYSAVFLGYGACRVMKAQALKARKPDKLLRRQAAALAGALAVAFCLTGAVSISAAKGEEALAGVPVQQESQQPEGPEGDLEQSPEPEVSALEDTQDAESESPAVEENPVPSEEQTEETVQSAQPSAEPVQEPVEEPGVSASTQAQQKTESTPAPETTPAPTPPPTPARTYRNGTFSGSGEGYWSTITVSVTIQDDVITGITVTSADEDEPFYSNALAVIDRILALQSTNVDTVSGATYSSGGIIDAVAAALASAKN